MPGASALFELTARSIYRKSRADEGKLGVWLVMARNPTEARALWEARMREGLGDWVYESAVALSTPIKRLH